MRLWPESMCLLVPKFQESAFVNAVMKIRISDRRVLSLLAKWLLVCQGVSHYVLFLD